MDIFARLLLRMSLWSRRRPSRAYLITLAVVAVGIVTIVAIERFVGWPDMLTTERLPRRPGLSR